MKPLREVIRIFQREVTAALDGMNETGQGMVWKPERVTLLLDVVLDEAGVPQARIHPSDDLEAEGGPGHRLTIEFRLQHADTMATGEGAAVVRAPIERGSGQGFRTSPETSEADVDRTYEDLRAILGERGFDSSARAAVFCEALQKLSLPQAFALCGALTSPSGEVNDETLRRARHQMLGIIRSGSLKSPERAAEILTHVFEAWPLARLVRFVADRWKTHDTWKD